MSLIEVDNARRSDLSVVGWLGIGFAVTGLAYAGWTLVTAATVGGGIIDGLVVGIGAALLGGYVAYEIATPEMDAMCGHCGDRIFAHSGRDGHDETIEAHCSSDPRRGELGPLSVVLQRRTATFHYCSGECAAADAERRRLQSPSQTDTESTAAGRLAATDGGTDRLDQLIDAVDQEGSGAVRDDALIDALESARNQGVPQPETGDSDR
ncbi:hypothetical protein [Haloarcula sp. JP-Z28]|uniref:hypothetical protein n=1 Tax=Haloarcula sp. JP-Z28 TaxID=2716715 RepID=UPI001F0477E3|nr:hypothetical protein [Haloarcula sp. JP-Z28]